MVGLPGGVLQEMDDDLSKDAVQKEKIGTAVHSSIFLRETSEREYPRDRGSPEEVSGKCLEDKGGKNRCPAREGARSTLPLLTDRPRAPGIMRMTHSRR